MPPRRQGAGRAGAAPPPPPPQAQAPPAKSPLFWTILSTIATVIGLGIAAGALYLGWAAWMATKTSNLMGEWKDCRDRDDIKQTKTCQKLATLSYDDVVKRSKSETEFAPEIEVVASGQILLWAVCPLVVATIMQPCGKLCGLSGSYRRFLRVSPLVCVADTIMILIRWALLPFLTGITFHRSWQILIEERFEANTGRDHHRDPSFVQLILALSVIPQAIKTCAIQNIPYTKAWTFMYLVSLLAVELMALFERRHLRVGDGPAKRTSSDISKSEKKIYDIVAMIVFVNGSLEIFAISGFFEDKSILACLSFNILSCAIIVLGVIEISVVLLRFSSYMLVGDDFGSKFVALNNWLDELRSEKSAAYTLSFAGISLVICICWYTSVYDSAGTSKPSWADYLG